MGNCMHTKYNLYAYKIEIECIQIDSSSHTSFLALLSIHTPVCSISPKKGIKQLHK